MRRWLLSKKPLTIFLALVCLVFGILVLNSFSLFNSEGDNLNSSVITSEKSPPARIRIPSIEVDAAIESVGLNRKNEMEAPDGPKDTAWFNLGPSPGEKGSAVIAGHRGWKIGPAVFDNLHKIKEGDRVYIEDSVGSELVFEVRELRTYDAKERVPEVWNKDDASHLNLITCSGNFNILTGTSEERLVVFTDLVTP